MYGAEERDGVSHACTVQWRCDESGRAARATGEVLNGWLTEEGLRRLVQRRCWMLLTLSMPWHEGRPITGGPGVDTECASGSGASRTYYVGIESAMPAVPGMEAPMKALCVVPFGMEEGTEAKFPGREFGLVLGEPAEFRFLSSTVRKQDRVGDLAGELGRRYRRTQPARSDPDIDGQQGTVLPVRLESRVTEIGTLEVWCVSRDGAQRWKLELNIRKKDESTVC